MTEFVSTNKRWRPSGHCPKCNTWRQTLRRLDLAGKRHSQDVLRRIRKSRGTYGPISQQHRESIRRWATGRRHTPEAKEKIRQLKLAYWARRQEQHDNTLPVG